LAVGMYLPWTVTFPILLGGLVYKFVEWRSRARGDSPEVQQAGIQRGLLFSSGLVAGEAIMGILIALLMMTPLEMPLLENWPKGGLPVDLVSLAALAAVMGLLVLKSLRRSETGTGPA
jgi:hypothetical protein